MSTPLPSLPALVGSTIRTPRPTAQRILSLGLPRRALWDALALGVVLTVLLLEILVLSTTHNKTDPVSQMMREIYGNPLIVLAGQSINAVVAVYAVHRIGAMFGGRGDLDGALALLAWHQIFILIVGLAAMAIGVLMPPLLAILLIVVIVLYFHVLTQFVCALHGFERALPVFAVIIVSMMAIYLLISIVTTILATILLGGPPHV